MTVVTLEMTDEDFERLTVSAMAWGASWREQVEDGRFEHSQKPGDAQPQLHWAMAYWVGDNWLTVMMIRAYLDAIDQGYEVVWDQADEPEYVILTDFKTERTRATDRRFREAEEFTGLRPGTLVAVEGHEGAAEVFSLAYDRHEDADNYAAWKVRVRLPGALQPESFTQDQVTKLETGR